VGEPAGSKETAAERKPDRAQPQVKAAYRSDLAGGPDAKTEVNEGEL